MSWRNLAITFSLTLILSLTAYFVATSFLSQIHPQASIILLLYLYIIIAPQVCILSANFNRFINSYLGVLLGLGWLCFLPEASAGLYIAASFVLFVVMAAKVFSAVSVPAVRLFGFVLTLFFVTSFLWTAQVFSDAGLSYIAVWLAPQAVISAAFKNFSFAHLPDVYNVWLGPVCPLPDNFWLAGLYYLIPAVILMCMTNLSKRIWRNA